MRDKKDRSLLVTELLRELGMKRAAELAPLTNASESAMNRWADTGNMGGPAEQLLSVYIALCRSGRREFVLSAGNVDGLLPPALREGEARTLTTAERLNDLAGWLESIGRELDVLLPRAEAEGLRVDRVGRAQFAAEAAAGQLRAVLAGKGAHETMSTKRTQ